MSALREVQITLSLFTVEKSFSVEGRVSGQVEIYLLVQQLLRDGTKEPVSFTLLLRTGQWLHVLLPTIKRVSGWGGFPTEGRIQIRDNRKKELWEPGGTTWTHLGS